MWFLFPLAIFLIIGVCLWALSLFDEMNNGEY